MSKPAYGANVSHSSSVVSADVTAPYWLFVCPSVHRVLTIFGGTYGFHLQDTIHIKTDRVWYNPAQKKICATALLSVAENNRRNKTIH